MEKNEIVDTIQLFVDEIMSYLEEHNIDSVSYEEYDKIHDAVADMILTANTIKGLFNGTQQTAKEISNPELFYVSKILDELGYINHDFGERYTCQNNTKMLTK